MRLLFIEDDRELAGQLRDILGSAGFAVDLAMDGETGLALGEVETYDVAVVDLALPKIQGLEVLRRWRAARRSFPVWPLWMPGNGHR